MRLSVSDTIIVFDYPKRIIYWRLLKRYVQYRQRQRPDMPDGWREHFNIRFVKTHVIGFKSKYHTVSIPILELVADDKEIITFQHPREARRFLARVMKHFINHTR
jgi:adenylate kinase family enzyme